MPSSQNRDNGTMTYQTVSHDDDDDNDRRRRRHHGVDDDLPPVPVADVTTVHVDDENRSASSTTPKKSESALKSFLAGGFGGVCIVLVGHPLDLIKVRMQTATGQAGHSVVAMARKTVAEHGLRGLYRGVSAPLVAISPIFALSFWGYDMGCRLVRYVQPPATAGHDDAQLTIGQKCVAGGLSALPTTALMAPSERIKCLLQTNDTKYKGMLDCGLAIYKEGGVRSLFRGTGATLLRDVPGSVAWFGMYEFAKLGIMKLQGMEDMTQLSPLAVLTAGGLAGMANWTVAIPPDVLKSRFQSAPEGTYRNLYHVYTDLMAKQGAGALFAGIRPAMIRAFPANAACFMGMEQARRWLSFMD